VKQDGHPSLLITTSISAQSASWRAASRIAASVFSGASPEAPRWATTSMRSAAPATAGTLPRTAATAAMSIVNLRMSAPSQERVCRGPTPLPGHDPTPVTLADRVRWCGYLPDFIGDG